MGFYSKRVLPIKIHDYFPSMLVPLLLHCISTLSTACPTSSDIFQSCLPSSKRKLVGLFCHVSVRRDVRALASSFAPSFSKCHYRYISHPSALTSLVAILIEQITLVHLSVSTAPIDNLDKSCLPPNLPATAEEIRQLYNVEPLFPNRPRTHAWPDASPAQVFYYVREGGGCILDSV